MRTVPEILRYRAREQRDDVALWYDGRTTSYAELDKRASVVANALVTLVLWNLLVYLFLIVAPLLRRRGGGATFSCHQKRRREFSGALSGELGGDTPCRC